MADTSLEIVISGRDNFSGTANRVIGSLNGINASAGRVGRGIGQVAGGLARIGMIAGGAVAAGLVVSAKAAISFEDAFAGVRKTADLTETEFTALAGSFRSMATEIPISANELAKLGEIAGALGITGVDNIREFSRVTALLGVTTDLTADAAATSLGHIATVLRLTGKDYETFADALVNLGNKGASTESQIAGIAERAAGGAATIGLATNELLAWSAAIANIGVEVEAGGTNFQKILIEAVKFAAEGGAELKTLAAVSGVTAAAWKKNFGTDPNSALSQFVVGLGKLSQEQQVLALGELGWDNQRTARILLGLAANTDNLTQAFTNAGVAAKGALTVESEKRFATLASQIKVLKGNFVEAAMTIGEGFTPALGRAVAKLTAFLKLDTTKASLREFGEDIGAALDGINWGEVLDGAKTFVGLLKAAASVILSLPTEIKAAGAAFIGLNTLSGGLIGAGAGNIVAGLAGGAARGVAAKVPGIGSIFAQPVYVTNWPLGGLGGGTGGGTSGVSNPTSWFRLLVPLAVAAAAVELGVVASGVNDPRHQQIDPATGRTRTFRGTNVPSEQITNLERTADRIREQLAAGNVTGGGAFERKQLAGVEAEIAKLRGDVRAQTGVIETGRSTVDSREGEGGSFMQATASFKQALEQTFGTHAAATFGSNDLAQFRGGDMSLLDERIRYLSGAQGSGAGSEQFLAVVGRDIAALKTALPQASGAEADKIRAGIDILAAILEAKRFIVTPEVIEGARDPSRERTEGERATALMATLPDIRLNPITNVVVNLSWRDIQTKVTTQSRIGPTSGSAGRSGSFQVAS